MSTSLRSRFFLGLAACVVAAACSHKQQETGPEPIEVHCVGPELGAVDETMALRGRISAPPGGDLPVASQVPGRVLSVLVKEGQRIAQGEVVARVDDVASRDALLQANASLAQSRAAEANAQVTLERTKALVTRGIAARQELDDATARSEAARAGTSASLAVVDLARRTLGRVEVRSSFEGVVTRVWRGRGALVDGTSATPIVQLATSQEVEFVAEATAREYFAIAPGQPAKGELADHGSPFEGAVRARANALDPSTGLAAIRVSVSSSSVQLPLGAFGRVVLNVGHRDNVPRIPLAAIRGAVADGSEVAVCKDGKVQLRAVRTGWRDDERVEVTSGLEAQERVAIDHVLGLEDGAPIREAR